MVEEQCQQGCKWFQCFFLMAELAMFCKSFCSFNLNEFILLFGLNRYGFICDAGNSLVCRWHHHRRDPEELTGITGQAEGQGEKAAMMMMVTEEAEGTVPTSSPKLQNKKQASRQKYWDMFVVCFF